MAGNRQAGATQGMTWFVGFGACSSMDVASWSLFLATTAAAGQTDDISLGNAEGRPSRPPPGGSRPPPPLPLIRSDTAGTGRKYENLALRSPPVNHKGWA